LAYRIVQEALNNIARHADASQVSLTLSCRPERVELQIQDDGVGFEPGELSAEHLGLRIMKERAEAIEAELSIQSNPGLGTAVYVRWRPEEDENTS
jgi:signal transduction histidine kinase